MDIDTKLARSLVRRDRVLWSALYDQHVSAVFGLAYHLVGGDRSVAEDVNQEVWLLAIEKIETFDPARGGFREWLLGIARHCALRRLRRDPARGIDSRADGPSNSPSPPESLEVVERADMVRAALLYLHDDRRRVLLDKYVEGFSVAEIAVRMGRSAKAVESLLTRAREQLRTLMSPYFADPTGGDSQTPNPIGGGLHASSDARPS